jgi:hypothetical protein
LFIPEIVVAKPKYNAGYYQSNGYASLLELNALSINQYQPVDISGEQRDANGNIKRLLARGDAFEAAYLFSNINEKNKKIDISSDLPEVVANFLFQKIVTSEMNTQGQMSRLVGCENQGASPDRDGAGKPIHSKKFLSFGIQRIEYPENEIKEYVTYNFAIQAARQLQYNKWRDGIGFEEVSKDEVGTGFLTDIKEKKTQENLKLADNYLILSIPLLETDATKRWKPIAEYWESITNRIKEDIDTNRKETRLWLTSFTNE